MKQKADVATPSPSVAYAEGKRQLSRDLMGGTEAMIAAGQRWLLTHPGEIDGSSVTKNYTTRLNSNILTNFLAQAIDKQVGKIFAKEIALGDNVPPDIVALCENIDRQGRSLNSFVMDVSRSAFVDGISYILADYPKMDKATTLAEEKALGARPYAVHVKAEQLLEVLAEMINGVETITRIRIKEEISKPVADWEYAEVEQVRVFRREPDGSIWFELWQEDEKRDKWVKIDEAKTGLQRINLVPIYTNRTGFMQGLPGNQAVAELNLRHWRSTSEQIYTVTMQRFGMLACSGVDPADATSIGAGKKLATNNPDAKFYYVEPSGKGAEMGRLDIESIEAAIESAPVNTRIESAGTVTATAAAIDSAENNAGLKSIAGGIKDSVEQLFMHFAEMMGKGADGGGEVIVNDDFDGPKGTQAGLASLDKARTLGDISRQNYLKELQRRGELASDMDLDVNDEELSAEPPDIGAIL